MARVHLVPGLFIIVFLVCAAGFAGAVMLHAHEGIEKPRLETVLNGRWATAYEKTFNKKIQVYEPSVTMWGMLNYAFFKEGNEGVLIGDNGWLFTKEEFDFFPNQKQETQKKIEFIADARDQLAKKNARLLVVIVPAKARIYDEHLGRYQFPSYREGIYEETLNEMRERGIAVADLRQPMEEESAQKELFLKTDTHWTPDGAEVAAETVASQVRKSWPGLSFEPASFNIRETGTETYEGDLMRYVPLGAFGEEAGPQPDRLAKVETERKGGNTGATADDLFGVKKLPVALVGTSYSANPKWNFSGFLAQSLHTEVLNAAKEGLGPFETMKSYLADESLNENPPELVIWEIPERYFPVSYKL